MSDHDTCVHWGDPCGNGCPADYDGPCQPIGCDNGYHLPGCQFIVVDAEPGPPAERFADGYPHYGTGPDGHCNAHGEHPHAGMRCLDCPICRPAEPTKGGTE